METGELEKLIIEAREGMGGIIKDDFSFHLGFCRGYSAGHHEGRETMKKIRDEHEAWLKRVLSNEKA